MEKSLSCKMRCLCVFLCLASTLANSQGFTWIKGTKLTDQNGYYGTSGVPNSGNNPGGREGACTWKDSNGNFWMFGGDGYDHIGNFGLLNALWKYTPSTNEWTWMTGDDIINQIADYGTKGVSAATNKPGGRSNGVTWVDASGNFWLFGGYGFDATSAQGYLNDLWKYNLSTNEWTWISGNNTCYQPGVYGTMGTASATNIPGARYGAVAYSDASNNLWLFSGFGNTSSSVTVGSLNDVWKYNITLNEWTWMNGSSIEDQNGTYGNMGTSAPGNTPGGRDGSSAWKDASGNFWMYGGYGWDASGMSGAGFLNDLWKYSPSTNEWSWMKGNNTLNQIGTYGVQGVGNPSNYPGGRYGASSWYDAAGNIWLFAGEGYAASSSSTNTTGELNDLWKYNVSNNEWTWVTGAAVLDQQGNYGSQGLSSITNMPGARSFMSSWMDANNNLWFLGGYGQAETGSSGGPGDLNDLWKYTNCFIAPITLTITSHDSIICSGETTSLTVIGGSNYTWTFNNSINGYLLISPNVNTTYSVYTTDNNTCKYYSSFTQTVEACTSLSENKVSGNAISIYPNPSTGEFKVKGITTDESLELKLFDQLGQLILQKQIDLNTETIKTLSVNGIYYYTINKEGKPVESGKLIVQSNN